MCHKSGCQQQTFRTGRTGSVQPEIRNIKRKKSIGGTDALILQVSRKQRTDIFRSAVCLRKRQIECHMLHFAFGFFPRLSAESVGRIAKIKQVSERSLFFLLSHHGCRAKKIRIQIQITFRHFLFSPIASIHAEPSEQILEIAEDPAVLLSICKETKNIPTQSGYLVGEFKIGQRIGSYFNFEKQKKHRSIKVQIRDFNSQKNKV